MLFFIHVFDSWIYDVDTLISEFLLISLGSLDRLISKGISKNLDCVTLHLNINTHTQHSIQKLNILKEKPNST